MAKKFSTPLNNLVLVSLVVIATACGLQEPAKKSLKSGLPIASPSSSPAPGGGSGAGLTYFNANVYPILKSSNRCGACHTPGPIANTPLFADLTSASNAYSQAKIAIASFANIMGSDIWDYTAGSHAAHCGVPNCNDANFGNNLSAALVGWANAEMSVSASPTPSPSPTAGFVNLNAISIASGLVTANGAAATLPATAMTTLPAPTPTYLKVDLTAAGLPGATLYFILQRYQVATAMTNGAYYLAQPTIVSSTAFTIKGINVTLVNGASNSQWNAWTSVNMAIPVNTTFPGTQINSVFQIIPSLGLTGDGIQIGISK